MPTPEENMQSVRTFAEEVFGNKNLKYATDWLADDFVEHQAVPGTTPDKKGAIDSYRSFFAASPDMTAEIHDTAAAGDKVAIRATYRGTDKGLHPEHACHRKKFPDGGHIYSPDQRHGQIGEHWGVVDTIGTMGQLGLLPPRVRGRVRG